MSIENNGCADFQNNFFIGKASVLVVDKYQIHYDTENGCRHFAEKVAARCRRFPLPFQPGNGGTKPDHGKCHRKTLKAKIDKFKT